jgi:hypothetical protein
MDDAHDWNRLDAAGYRVSIMRSVRRMAWIISVVGVVVAACGVAAGLGTMVAVGVVLACAGAWNLFRTSVRGLVVDGVAMVLTGVFLALAWRWMDAARASQAANSILAGVIQIVWGVRRLALYRTARFAPNDPQAIARLASVVRDVSRRDLEADPTVAEFRTGRVRHHRNRLGLYVEGAVALLEHQAVRLEKRTDIWIEPSGSTTLGRSIKVRIQMSDLELPGEMSVEHYARFERWKLGLSEARSIAA